MLYVALALLLFSIILLKRQVYYRFTALVVSLSVFLLLLLSGFYFISNHLTGNGIDESVYYHLTTDLKGAGLSEFTEIIVYSSIYFIAILSISFLSYRLVKTNNSSNTSIKRKTFPILLFILSFYINPGVAGIFSIYTNILETTYGHEAPEEYNTIKNLKLNGKNIVYIYLESLERTYLDDTLFPDLAKNLRELENEALTFTDIRQIYGSGWTIAGKVSSQCGIPLVTPSDGNSMAGIDKFLPEATCIGDILKENGYSLSYLGGSRLEFAGKGNFYKTHGFDNVYGLNELKAQIDNSSYISSWGLYDDSLFELVKNEYDNLSSNSAPFGLFTLTLDTHHPVGHESKYCANTKYKDGSNSILNAVHCADKLVYDLVNHIKSSVAYKNTIIIISSDHLAMRNTAYDTLQEGDRKNLFMVLNAGVEGRSINSAGALIDVTPTVLGLLGANIESFGFGTNLLSGLPSLTRKSDSIDSLLSSYRGFISSFWSFPQIRDGITINSNKKELVLGKRIVRYPVLFDLDHKLNVNSIKLDFSSPKKLIEYISENSFDERFIWVDSCSKVRALSTPPKKYRNEFCMALGALGADKIEIIPLQENTTVGFSHIKNSFKSNDFEQTLAERRVEKIQNIHKYGTPTLYVYKSKKKLEGDFIITSAGFGSGSTVIENLKSQSSINASRGLTLVGLNPTSPPIEITHLDTCGNGLEQLGRENYKFQQDINRLSSSFGAFAIVAHDSAICDQLDLSSLFEESGLIKWDEIGFRTPYIGIITGNGDIIERTDSKESKIAINAKDFIKPL